MTVFPASWHFASRCQCPLAACSVSAPVETVAAVPIGPEALAAEDLEYLTGNRTVEYWTFED